MMAQLMAVVRLHKATSLAIDFDIMRRKMAALLLHEMPELSFPREIVFRLLIQMVLFTITWQSTYIQ